MVGHADVELARARNNLQAGLSKNTKSLLKQVKVANTHETRLDLLTKIRYRKTEVDVIAESKIQKKMNERLNFIHRCLVS